MEVEAKPGDGVKVTRPSIGADLKLSPNPLSPVFVKVYLLNILIHSIWYLGGAQ